MDPVQFGIVMLINCALGLNTPPVAVTPFVGISVGQVMRSILTYVPAFSLWLPGMFNK